MSDDEESLAATRSRRANAGSRLKQLIALEEQSSDHLNQFVTEDDENVNLLFQEDENDDEFIDEDVDNDNLEGIDEEDEEEEGEEEEEGGEGDGSTSRKRPREEGEDDDDETNVNSDDVLSDSELSMSDSDESEGEKELQKQERLKKRRNKTIIPTIKKATPLSQNPHPKKAKRANLVTSESLLLSQRRSSSRSAAIENKQALVEKLKQSEERRSKIAPVVRVQQVELTQEERLAEAVETERGNVESLIRFQEQEIFKKEKQKQMFLSKRPKLRNVIRIQSKDTYITPIEEITEFRKMHEITKKKKVGRRKKIQSEEAEPYVRLPGEVDLELPLVKEEMERARVEKERLEREAQEAAEAEAKAKLLEEGVVEEAEKLLEGDDAEEVEVEAKAKPLEGDVVSSEGDVATEKETDGKDELEAVKLEEANGEIHHDSNGGGSIPVNDGVSEQNSLDDDDDVLLSGESIENSNGAPVEVEGEVQKDTSQIETNTEVKVKQEITDLEIEDKPITETGKNENATEEEIDNGLTVEGVGEADKEEIEIISRTDGDIVKDEPDETEISQIIEERATSNSEKKVKFLDEINNDKEANEETPVTDNEIGPAEIKPDSKEVFEGPPQRISRNTIFLLDFDEDNKDYRLNNTNNIKTILFGAQSLLPASRRFKDIKTVLKIGGKANPYENNGVKNDDDLFEPISNLTADDPIFEELKRLPRLGVKQDLFEEVEDIVETESTAIIIKTEAPTGLYLPNGNKKNCLISGTEVKYFDPSTGIPYSSVEAYRILKSIEQGQIPWYSLTDDTNDTGPVEIYLGSRDGSVKHAKGVPEGFEG